MINKKGRAITPPLKKNKKMRNYSAAFPACAVFIPGLASEVM
jgi:hypothetical protein